MSQPVCLPNTEVLALESREGRAYRILIGAPAGPTPPAGFPVVYLLDAHTCFGSMLESVRLRSRRPDATSVSPAIIVGITHAEEGPRLTAQRTYDFTVGECAGDAGAGVAGGHPDGKPGGALAFMEFLDTRVKPEVARRFSVCSSRQTLFGHSLGGYFVLQTLVSRPAAYSSFVAVSPSIWWDRERLFQDAAHAFCATGAVDSFSPQVLLYTGEYEESLAPWQLGTEAGEQTLLRRKRRSMIQNAEAFALHLRAISNDKIHAAHRCVDGEDHASLVSVAINEALRSVLAPS